MDELQPELRPPYEPLPPLGDDADEATVSSERAWEKTWRDGNFAAGPTPDQKTPLIRAPRAGVLPASVVAKLDIAMASTDELPLVPFSRFN